SRAGGTLPAKACSRLVTLSARRPRSSASLRARAAATPNDAPSNACSLHDSRLERARAATPWRIKRAGSLAKSSVDQFRFPERVEPELPDLAGTARIGLDQRAAPVPTILVRHRRAMSEKTPVHVGEEHVWRAERKRVYMVVDAIEDVERE